MPSSKFSSFVPESSTLIYPTRPLFCQAHFPIISPFAFALGSASHPALDLGFPHICSRKKVYYLCYKSLLHTPPWSGSTLSTNGYTPIPVITGGGVQAREQVARGHIDTLKQPLRRSLLIEEITPRETDDTLLLRGLDRRTDSQ